MKAAVLYDLPAVMMFLHKRNSDLRRNNLDYDFLCSAHCLTTSYNAFPFLFELPKVSTGDMDSSKKSYGQINFNFNDNQSLIPEPGEFSRVAGGDAKAVWYTVRHDNGLAIATATTSMTNTNSSAIRMRFVSGSLGQSGIALQENFAVTSINIRNVTGRGHYIIFGRRKWT